MISFNDAQKSVRSLSFSAGNEHIPIADAMGRVLAEDNFSAVNLPPFANSAMDGFALCSHGHTVMAGTEYAVFGEQAAGEGEKIIPSGFVLEIMTGAVLPEEFDAVIPVENIEVIARFDDGKPARIRLLSEVQPGQHRRRVGEDIACGALALQAGIQLAAQHVLLLAGLGIASVAVKIKPKIALICTGRELIDDATQDLLPGQIRNSNGPYLAARIPAAGAECVYRTTITDEPAAFDAALTQALAAGADIIISTGAVSMGRYDFVPASLQACGAEIIFHKVAMRPGKPLLFARLSERVLFFGLPGNPVSSAVGFRFFVETALRYALGLPEEKSWRLPLAHSARKKSGFIFLQKARLVFSPEGQLGVQLLAGQESFKTQPLVAATAWAMLPEDADDLPAGSLIDVCALGHEQGFFVGGQGGAD